MSLERPPANTPAGTHTAVLPPEAFAEEVRAALDHLYDSAFLHNHFLAWRLYDDAPAGGVTRAQRLRTLLLDAIEQLRPEPRFSADEMRAYAILTYRCMDGMSMDEIAAKLGLSRRQAYREYAKGVDAVAGFIWDTLPPQVATAAPVAPSIQPPASLPAADVFLAIPLAETTAEPNLAARLDAAAQEVARLTSGLLIESVDLPAVVANVAELLALRTERTGVRLHINPPALPAAVRADRTLLRQALLNLFSYALDQACRAGEVTVTWVKMEREAGLSLATCAVPHQATDGHAEAPARREGVGVSVAQKLIEAMGGRTSMEPTDRKWCCTLLLPVVQRATVLVVDDNADLIALFQRYAASQQLAVVGAASGAQALELARELRPQLILLDLMLSHMDGWEILQRLRAETVTQATTIVICSVLNEPELAYSLGANDYVTKPISQAGLIDVLRRWLGKQHPPA